MFKYTNDSAEIIDFLTDVDAMPATFDGDRVTSFYVGVDYYLLLFFSKEAKKSFRLFLVEDYRCNLADMELLKHYLDDVLPIEQDYIAIEATRQIDDYIRLVKESRNPAMKRDRN